jgi:hypothetical protein
MQLKSAGSPRRAPPIGFAAVSALLRDEGMPAAVLDVRKGQWNG